MNYPRKLKWSVCLASLCGLLSGFTSTLTTADSTPCEAAFTPYEAAYVTVYKNINLEGSRSLRRQDDGRFILTNKAKKMGSSISEHSLFTWEDNAIQVDEYAMTRSILGIKRKYHNRYDWAKGIVSVTGAVDIDLSLDNHPLDLLSYQLALRCDLEQGKEQLSYPVVARDRIKHYEFKVSGKETLKTRLGELETLVVERLRKDSDRTTRIWLAPGLNYLLVKLEQYEAKDNASYRLELKKVSFK